MCVYACVYAGDRAHVYKRVCIYGRLEYLIVYDTLSC